MELATAALGSLLQKLGSLLTEQYKLHKGVRGEIRFLQTEMESMEAVLNMLSKKPPHQISELDEIWARDLKELTYDIEDSVDTFIVHIDAPVQDKPHSFRRFFNRTMGLLTKAKVRHHVANDIDDIKKRIREVAEKRERYRLEGVAAGPDTTTVDPRVLACFEHSTELVGTDVPVEKVSSLLTKGKVAHQQKPMVVSIVGVGGLGKTTIASLVYQSLGGQFDCKAFVSVSLRPNMQQILGSILRQISKDTCTNAGEKDPQELIMTIREFLVDKRYFIVIDDVWSEEAWRIIKGALTDNDLGSKVILTTRNVDVAKFSSVDGAIYELGSLSYEHSKRLLCKRIFNDEEGILSELEEVTVKILKKCGGVPLAIITIASMLASIPNKSKHEWYGVYKSMGSGLETDKSLGNMREILHLSYRDLPSYLKPCLLYLSVFPEDYEIPKYTLILFWVAEGFIDSDRGSNLYDLGERYFNELVNRSMIQPTGMDKTGVAWGCRVHDMVLDLIIFLSHRENFMTISEDLHHISSTCKIRRLLLQGREEDSCGGVSKEEKVMLPATVDLSHVRTLFAVGNAFQWMPSLSRFSVLRVLVLKGFASENNNLKGLWSLHQLRYLEIHGTIETELLEEIGNLKHLKTLDLSCAEYGEELPSGVVQLRELECLVTDEGVKFPDGIGNLVFLQILDVLDVRASPETLTELANLTSLRYLYISGLADENESSVKKFLRSLFHLHNLHTLYIYNDVEEICSLDCMSDQGSGLAHLQIFLVLNSIISKLPRWFSSLTELSTLRIQVSMLRQDDIQLLGALPVLHFLRLKVAVNGTTEQQLVIGGDHPFHSLTDFKFKHFTRCRLVFAQGVMPKLQRLRLYFEVREREGGRFDVGLENLTSLKKVKVKFNGDGARIAEVENAETKYRDMIDKHPKHPTLEVSGNMNPVWRLMRTQAIRLLATVGESDIGTEASEQSPDFTVIDDESNNGRVVSE